MLGVLRSEILTGVRAYVGGEGLWSKAEKRAVLSLTEYARGRNETDYQHYLAEIAVPIGDKQARLQLQLPIARHAARACRDLFRAATVRKMWRTWPFVFRRFRRFGYMAQAIAIWTEGDRYIDQLRALADELHREISSPILTLSKIQQITDQIAAVDARLTPLKMNSRPLLGEGARWIESRALASPLCWPQRYCS